MLMYLIQWHTMEFQFLQWNSRPLVPHHFEKKKCIYSKMMSLCGISFWCPRRLTLLQSGFCNLGQLENKFLNQSIMVTSGQQEMWIVITLCAYQKLAKSSSIWWYELGSYLSKIQRHRPVSIMDGNGIQLVPVILAARWMYFEFNHLIFPRVEKSSDFTANIILPG